MPFRTILALGIVVAVACGGGQPKTMPVAVEHSLSGLGAQRVALLPTYGVRVMPGLAWGNAIGRQTDLQRTLDADIRAALEDRAIGKTWIYPEALLQSYRRNPTYGTDPYALAEEPLRAPNLALDSRLPDPLASQIRTLVALHSDTRLVLAPVDLRLEPAGTGGRGVLRLVLLDSRLSNVRWIGEISSDTVAAFGPVVTASIASRLANVIAAP
jgi:hypothetical protein